MGVIKRQSIKNIATGYLGILIGFINLLIIQPQFLTAEELGLTRILYSFALLIGSFIPLGSISATLKYFPLFKDEKSRHHGFFGLMILFPLTGFALSFIIIYIFKPFFIGQYTAQSPLFAEFFNYVFPMMFAMAFISSLNAYCYSLLKSTVPSFLNDIVSRLLVALVVTVYYNKWIDLNMFITSFVFIYFLQLVFLACYIYYEDKPGLKIDGDFLLKNNPKKMLRYGTILWLASVAGLGLKEMGTIVTGKFLPLSEVAVYAVASFIPMIIEAPLNALDKIAGSKISYAWTHNNKTELADIYHKSATYLLLIGGLLFIGININIHDLLFFLPAKYQQGTEVVAIISIGTLINMATGLNGSILFYSDKYQIGAAFMMLLIIINFSLQIILIPLLGINGTAIATAGSSILYNIMCYFFIKKNFGLQPFNRQSIYILSIIIACMVFGVLIPETDSRILNITLRSLIVTIIFTSIIYKLKIAPDLNAFLKKHLFRI